MAEEARKRGPGQGAEAQRPPPSRGFPRQGRTAGGDWGLPAWLEVRRDAGAGRQEGPALPSGSPPRPPAGPEPAQGRAWELGRGRPGGVLLSLSFFVLGGRGLAVWPGPVLNSRAQVLLQLSPGTVLRVPSSGLDSETPSLSRGDILGPWWPSGAG